MKYAGFGSLTFQNACFMCLPLALHPAGDRVDDRTNHTVTDLTVNDSFTLLVIFICMVARGAKGVTFRYPLVVFIHLTGQCLLLSAYNGKVVL